jgi:hypothetical protein
MTEGCDECVREENGRIRLDTAGMAVSFIGIYCHFMGYTIYFTIYLVGCPGVESLIFMNRI